MRPEHRALRAHAVAPEWDRIAPEARVRLLTRLKAPEPSAGPWEALTEDVKDLLWDHYYAEGFTLGEVDEEEMSAAVQTLGQVLGEFGFDWTPEREQWPMTTYYRFELPSREVRVHLWEPDEWEGETEARWQGWIGGVVRDAGRGADSLRAFLQSSRQQLSLFEAKRMEQGRTDTDVVADELQRLLDEGMSEFEAVDLVAGKFVGWTHEDVLDLLMGLDWEGLGLDRDFAMSLDAGSHPWEARTSNRGTAAQEFDRTSWAASALFTRLNDFLHEIGPRYGLVPTRDPGPGYGSAMEVTLSDGSRVIVRVVQGGPSTLSDRPHWEITRDGTRLASGLGTDDLQSSLTFLNLDGRVPLKESRTRQESVTGQRFYLDRSQAPWNTDKYVGRVEYRTMSSGHYVIVDDNVWPGSSHRQALIRDETSAEYVVDYDDLISLAEVHEGLEIEIELEPFLKQEANSAGLKVGDRIRTKEAWKSHPSLDDADFGAPGAPEKPAGAEGQIVKVTGMGLVIAKMDDGSYGRWEDVDAAFALEKSEARLRDILAVRAGHVPDDVRGPLSQILSDPFHDGVDALNWLLFKGYSDEEGMEVLALMREKGLVPAPALAGIERLIRAAMMEEAPEGWEGTVKAMKDEPDVDNPYALTHWMDKQGYRSHKKDDGSDKDEAWIRDPGSVAPDEVPPGVLINRADNCRECGQSLRGGDIWYHEDPSGRVAGPYCGVCKWKLDQDPLYERLAREDFDAWDPSGGRNWGEGTAVRVTRGPHAGKHGVLGKITTDRTGRMLLQVLLDEGGEAWMDKASLARPGIGESIDPLDVRLRDLRRGKKLYVLMADEADRLLVDVRAHGLDVELEPDAFGLGYWIVPSGASQESYGGAGTEGGRPGESFQTAGQAFRHLQALGFDGPLYGGGTEYWKHPDGRVAVLRVMDNPESTKQIFYYDEGRSSGPLRQESGYIEGTWDWECPECREETEVSYVIDPPDYAATGFRGDITTTMPAECSCGYVPTQRDRDALEEDIWEQVIESPPQHPEG